MQFTLQCRGSCPLTEGPSRGVNDEYTEVDTLLHRPCVRTLFTTAAILFGDVYRHNILITPQLILNCLRRDAPRSDGYTMRINMQLWLHHTTRPQHQSRPSDGKSAVTIHPVCLTSSMLSLGDETQFPESSKAAAPRREDRRGDRR